jgi:hypothetical protein
LALLCVLLLALGLSVQAGTFLGDPDGDNLATGVPEWCDNCHMYNFSGDNCPDVFDRTQYDSDGDGYGNACDGDFNNDSDVELFDFSTFKATYGQSAPTYNEQADLDCNGTVNLFDFATFKNLYGNGLGTGKICAGDKGDCYVRPCIITPAEKLQIEFQEAYAVDLPETIDVPHVMYAPPGFDWPEGGVGAIQVKYTSFYANVPNIARNEWVNCDSWVDGILPDGWNCRVYSYPPPADPMFNWWDHTFQFSGTDFPDDCIEEEDAAPFYIKFQKIATVPWYIPSAHPASPYPIFFDGDGPFALFDCDGPTYIDREDLAGYSFPYIPQ